MKWWQITILAFLFVAAGAYVGIAMYVGSVSTKVERVPVNENPADLGLEYKDIEFKSRDGLNLRGWLLPSRDDGRVIIMAHGGEMHRADPTIGMLDIAAALVEHNYSVLMFDFRGHGESEGERMSAGYFEKNDLLGAVDYAKENGYEQIGVLGFSMGGAVALIAGADCVDIDCIVSDTCYADLADIMGREFKVRTGLPQFLLSPVLSMVKFIYKADFHAVKPVEDVAYVSPRPILFIHGAEDTFVPLEHVYRLIKAADNPRNELWIAPGAEHVRSYITNPTEYIKKIDEFFNENLR